MKKIKELSSEICNNWKIEDPRFKQDIERKLELWLAPIQDEMVKNILINLLKNFTYYDRENASLKYIELYRELKSQIGEENLLEKTLFFPVTKNNRRTSSNEVYINFTYANDISKYCCLNDVSVFLEEQKQLRDLYYKEKEKSSEEITTLKKQIKEYETIINGEKYDDKVIRTVKKRLDKNKKRLDSLRGKLNEIKSYDLFNVIENLVFIDDMVGTGETMKKFLNKMLINKIPKQIAEKINIYLISLEACGTGLDLLKEYSETQCIKFNVIHSNKHIRAFTPDYIYTEQESNQMRSKIFAFEKDVLKSSHPLGYSETEALMAFYHNTPNNTLSSFWYNENNWNGVFPRRKDLHPSHSDKKSASAFLEMMRLKGAKDGVKK